MGVPYDGFRGAIRTLTPLAPTDRAREERLLYPCGRPKEEETRLQGSAVPTATTAVVTGQTDGARCQTH